MGEATRIEKKILIATPLYPPEIGGPATYTLQLEKELPKHGFSVCVVAFARSRTLPKGISHLHFFARVLRAMKGVDFVLAQDPVSVGLPTILAAKLMRKKVVIRMPGDYAWEQSVQRFGITDSIDTFQGKKYAWRVELLRKLQRWVSRQAVQVIVPSKYFKEVVGTWGIAPDAISVVYNGLEMLAPPQEAARQERTIVTSGRLVPWKGVGALIALMAEVPDWQLVVLGDGPERETLERTAVEQGVAQRVTFKGSVSHEQVLKQCVSASLFVLNTHFESFSFQTVEAMMVGARVVVTNIGSLPELITDGVEGRLIAPDDMQSLKDIIAHYDADEAAWDERSRKAQKKAEKFSVEQTVLDTLAVFAKV